MIRSPLSVGVRRALRALALSLALLPGAIACGESAGEAAPASGRGGPGGPGGGPRISPVEVAPVVRTDLMRTTTLSGVIAPIRNVDVNSQLSGALLSVLVEEGDRVTRGQLLARLDDREIRAQLVSAEAAFESAAAALERAEALREERVITAVEYERDRTAHAAARATLDQLRTRIGYATVNAPIEGVITEKLVERGDIVAPQTRLFTIADISTLVVPLHVSELDIGALSAGERVRVRLDAHPGRELEGVIRRIFPAADPATRLVPIEVALPAAWPLAKPGFLARVDLDVDVRRDALVVPVAALTGTSGQQAVFVVEQGLAFRRPVSTGITSSGKVEILSGLAAQDTVVVAGHTTLRDSAQVRIVPGPGRSVSDTPVRMSAEQSSAAAGGGKSN